MKLEWDDRTLYDPRNKKGHNYTEIVRATLWDKDAGVRRAMVIERGFEFRVEVRTVVFDRSFYDTEVDTYPCIPTLEEAKAMALALVQLTN